MESTSRQVRVAALFLLFCVVLGTSGTLFATPAPVRLTNSSDHDYYPCWHPTTETIVFSRMNYTPADAPATTRYLNSIYQVKGDNSVPEALVATGYPFQYYLGLGTGYHLSWIGSTNTFMLMELVFLHEYMTFNLAGAPFSRSVMDGSDSAFTSKLIVDGGGGGGLTKVSRDGSKVLIRFSDNGGSGVTTIRTGPFSSMTGQAISSWKNAAGVVTHISEFVPDDRQFYQSGASFLPDGSKFVIARHANASLKLPPYDLWLYNTDGSGTPINLTNVGTGGKDFRFPDISADGQKIVCSCADAAAANTTWDLCTMNLDGSNVVNVTNSSTLHEYAPSWSPNGDRVAFMGSWTAGNVPAGEAAVWKIYALTLMVDCNGNQIPDVCDLDPVGHAGECGSYCATPGMCGQATDCDLNAVPDSCDPDADGDSVPDACDGCDEDPNKSAPGTCGCGLADTDSDSDGTPNCNDGCSDDPAKTAPGVCGCGVTDTDSDSDGAPNCNDGCSDDPAKTAPGVCGCGVTDTDSDSDGTPNCNDGCGNDPAKTAPGVCGCGVADVDRNSNGVMDCFGAQELKLNLGMLQRLLAKLKNPKLTNNPAKNRKILAKLRAQINEIKAALAAMDALVAASGAQIQLKKPTINLTQAGKALRKFITKALKVQSRTFAADKKRALAELKKLLGLVV